VDNVICVGAPAGPCNQTVGSIQVAITAANANAVDDTILVGPGGYSDGPYNLNGVAHALTLKGSGQGSDPASSTILTLVPSANINNYVSADHATVQNLRVVMAGGANSNDTGISLSNASADHLTIAGATSVNSTGAHLTDATITSSTVDMSPLPVPGARAIYAEGGSTASDVALTGSRGFVQSAGGKTDVLTRATIQSGGEGILTDGGTITIDDTVIDMGSGGNTAGISAANNNDSATPKTINANHVTVVGSGAGSKGVWAFAASQGGKQTANISLSNSIVRGPATSLVADASNNGAQGGASTATINLSYTDFQNSGGTINATTGAGGIVSGAGNLLNVDPAFVNAGTGDYHLTPASPAVDKGNPAAGGPATDRDGLARVVDGDGNGTAVRDMGAYERPTVAVTPPTTVPDKAAPDTTITKQPKKKSIAAKAKLKFSSEAGATFQCQLDGGAWKACTSPYKVKVKVGKHTVLVRAIDKAGNVDATPAKAKFTRVEKPS
jgi:hypothetical protein